MMVSGSGPSHGRGVEGLDRVNYRPGCRSSVSVDFTSSNHYRCLFYFLFCVFLCFSPFISSFGALLIYRKGGVLCFSCSFPPPLYPGLLDENRGLGLGEPGFMAG